LRKSSNTCRAKRRAVASRAVALNMTTNEDRIFSKNDE